MQISFEIQDEIASAIAPEGESLSRAVLETLALEGYRSERLSESQVRTLLGFETRMQVHSFLKAHGCYLHYTVEDLERDRQAAKTMRTRRHSSPPDQERLAG